MKLSKENMVEDLKKSIEEKIKEIKMEINMALSLDKLSKMLNPNPKKDKVLNVVEKLQKHWYEKSKEEIAFFESILAELNEGDIETSGMVA